MTVNTKAISRRLTLLGSPRMPTAPQDSSRRSVLLLARLGGAALLVWMGYIHLHLWQEGYRYIPANGPLFLLDAMVAFVFAAVLAALAAAAGGTARGWLRRADRRADPRYLDRTNFEPTGNYATAR